MADPGFPMGGRGPVRGHFSAKMYVKTKELGPIGGVHPAHPPRSANGMWSKYVPVYLFHNILISTQPYIPVQNTITLIFFSTCQLISIKVVQKMMFHLQALTA